MRVRFSVYSFGQSSGFTQLHLQILVLLRIRMKFAKSLIKRLQALVMRAFTSYLNLMRKVQKTYWWVPRLLPHSKSCKHPASSL